jgi:hypothetical protein
MASLTDLWNDIKSLIMSSVIKFDRDAKAFESVDTARLGGSYVSAKRGIDTFHTYFKFDTDIFVSAGITNIDTIAAMQKDKYLIPVSKRDLIVTLQRNKIINTYNEYNNYYRTLWGMPPIEADLTMTTTDFRYVDTVTAGKYGIDPAIPLHLLPDNKIMNLEVDGFLGTLIEENKDNSRMKYLKFLGRHKVDPVISRPANNFTILTVMKDPTKSIFNSRVLRLYEECRNYFTSVIYVKEFSKSYEYYDNFMAFLIMIMTLQRFFSETIKDCISRDFFDIALVKDFFDSYNVPFMEKLPYEYQIILCKKLNMLLQTKSTDKVLFDLCTLLDFGDTSIYTYYIMKKHKTDITGTPLFFYKTITNPDNSTSVVLDKELMYDFYFQKVSKAEVNLAKALMDNTNTVLYEEVTNNDPYWFNDQNTLDVLYQQEYNFAESKYIGLNIIFKMSKILFEAMYFTRMIFDKRLQLEVVTITVPKISGLEPIKVFDAFVLLGALICRVNGFQGRVFAKPNQLMSLYGFDFTKDLVTIREYITDNSQYIDQKILDYFFSLDTYSVDEVNSVYAHIRDFNDFAIKRMALTQDIKEFRAYEKLYKMLMFVKENEISFKKSDDTQATTYMDLLNDKNPFLYNFANNLNTNQVSGIIDSILNKLLKVFYELKYIHHINNGENIFLDALIELIKFFKSYTVDLASINIVYLFDSRYFNMIKTLGYIQGYKTLQIEDGKPFKYFDMIKSISHLFTHKDTLSLEDGMRAKSSLNIKEDTIENVNKIKDITIAAKFGDDLTLFDSVQSIGTDKMVKDRISLRDKIRIIPS